MACSRVKVPIVICKIIRGGNHSKYIVLNSDIHIHRISTIIGRVLIGNVKSVIKKRVLYAQISHITNIVAFLN
jgi:hypothetical protein